MTPYLPNTGVSATQLMYQPQSFSLGAYPHPTRLPSDQSLHAVVPHLVVHMLNTLMQTANANAGRVYLTNAVLGSNFSIGADGINHFQELCEKAYNILVHSVVCLRQPLATVVNSSAEQALACHTAELIVTNQTVAQATTPDVANTARNIYQEMNRRFSELAAALQQRQQQPQWTPQGSQWNTPTQAQGIPAWSPQPSIPQTVWSANQGIPMSTNTQQTYSNMGLPRTLPVPTALEAPTPPVVESIKVEPQRQQRQQPTVEHQTTQPTSVWQSTDTQPHRTLLQGPWVAKMINGREEIVMDRTQHDGTAVVAVTNLSSSLTRIDIPTVVDVLKNKENTDLRPIGDVYTPKPASAPSVGSIVATVAMSKVGYVTIQGCEVDQAFLMEGCKDTITLLKQMPLTTSLAGIASNLLSLRTAGKDVRAINDYLTKRVNLLLAYEVGLGGVITDFCVDYCGPESVLEHVESKGSIYAEQFEVAAKKLADDFMVSLWTLEEASEDVASCMAAYQVAYIHDVFENFKFRNSDGLLNSSEFKEGYVIDGITTPELHTLVMRMVDLTLAPEQYVESRFVIGFKNNKNFAIVRNVFGDGFIMYPVNLTNEEI